MAADILVFGGESLLLEMNDEKAKPRNVYSEDVWDDSLYRETGGVMESRTLVARWASIYLLCPWHTDATPPLRLLVERIITAGGMGSALLSGAQRTHTTVEACGHDLQGPSFFDLAGVEGA
jgi:hypothetical protein